MWSQCTLFFSPLQSCKLVSDISADTARQWLRRYCVIFYHIEVPPFRVLGLLETAAFWTNFHFSKVNGRIGFLKIETYSWATVLPTAIVQHLHNGLHAYVSYGFGCVLTRLRVGIHQIRFLTMTMITIFFARRVERKIWKDQESLTMIIDGWS